MAGKPRKKAHGKTQTRIKPRGAAARAPLRRTALAARQHHPRQRHRLGPAAHGLSQRAAAALKPAADFAADPRSACRNSPTARRHFKPPARRREARAIAAREAGNTVTARENFLMAAVHWGAAQWPFDENNAENLFCNQRKRECYQAYAASLRRTASRKSGFRSRAWRCRRGCICRQAHQGGKLPAVVTIPGMDSFKEISVAMYGDRWLIARHRRARGRWARSI